ncbi:MAG: GH116 family glycosyl hydrolase, partial [Lentisphaerota bacterium]
MNILTNAGFERGNAEGWSNWNGSASIGTTSHFGNCSVKLGLLSSAHEGALIQEIASDFAPGESLYASAWIRTDDLNAYASVKIGFFMAGSPIGFVESRRLTGSNDWTKVTVSATIPTNATSIIALLYLWNSAGTGSVGNAYFDDAFLSQDIPSAAWSWPMGQLLSTVGHKRSDVGMDLIDDGIWNGVPIGGFGAGSIGRTFAGDFKRWHLDVGLHRNVTVPANQFSMFQKTGTSIISRVLWNWHPDGDPTNRPLKTWHFDYPGYAGTYYGLFPKAWWDYSENEEFPVDIACVQFSPTIPDNYRESSFPVGLYKWTAKNRTTNATDVSIMFTWENMTGWDPDDSTRWSASVVDPLWGASLGNYNYAKTEGDLSGVVLTGTRSVTNELDGEFCIAARQVPGVTVSYKGTFDCNGDGADVWDEFSDDGVLDYTDAQTVAGTNDDFGAAVAVSIHLEPGQEIEFPMALAWDFPIMSFSGPRKGEAFASSEEGSYVANDAFDGNPTTRWASAKTSNEWVCLDFKKPQFFNRVALTWEAAYAKSYFIEVSNDATNWTVIHAETNGNGNVDVLEVGEQQAQYVRMQGVERGLPAQGYSLWEFEVMLHGTTATASSVEGAGYEAEKAVDGNYATRWSSAASDNQWLSIDLGASRAFNFVTLNWEAAYAKAYEIQISSNASDWATVLTETNGNGGMDLVYVGEHAARYVKMRGLQRGTAFGYSLYEFSATHGAGPRKWFKYYTKFFGKSGHHAWDIAREALTNGADWEQQIDAWQKPILWDGSKPDWYKCDLFNQLYFLLDGGTAWENGLVDGGSEPAPQEDNKFALLECFDWGNYAAFDLETYSSFALATLWPELEKQMLRETADIMDGTSSARPSGKGSLLDGNVPHDMSDSTSSWRGDLDPWFRYNAYWNRDTTQWKDMNSKFMIRIYRDYTMTGDPEFLDPQLWQAVKVAMLRLRDRGDATSLPVNTGEDQTYDTWQMHGTSAYCGGLWLAALKAGIEIARIAGDAEVESLYTSWFDTAYPAFDSRLWNGEYYLYDTGSAGNSNSIMSDQLCGEWFAAASGLSVLPEDHVQSALNKIYQFNVMGAGLNGQRGAINGIYPDGTINTSSEQSQEAWVGASYGLCALMIHKGLLEQAEQTAWGIYHTIYEEKGYWFRTPEAWISNGNFRATMYNRPMAIWAL